MHSAAIRASLACDQLFEPTKQVEHKSFCRPSVLQQVDDKALCLDLAKS